MEIATFILAVWGAALSTLLAAIKLLRDRRLLAIRLVYGSGPSDLGGVDATMTIRCVNVGSRAVRVEHVIVEWADGSMGMSSNGADFPAKVEPNEHTDVVAILTQEASDPTRVVVVYNGKEARYDFDPDEQEMVRWAIEEVRERNASDDKTAWRAIPIPRDR